MKNIILIGMPGTGKSVVGRALAERLRCSFVDADDLIVETAGKTLPEILRTEGLDAFLKVEEEVGASISRSSTVIATGGSMVLSERAMEHLRKNGVVVWLETPLSQISDRMPEDLVDRGIAAPSGMTIREIYREREPLYARYADLIVAATARTTRPVRWRPSCAPWVFNYDRKKDSAGKYLRCLFGMIRFLNGGWRDRTGRC